MDPARPLKPVRGADLDLLFLVLLTAAVQWPYFKPNFITLHDTMFQMGLFHFFYSQWFFHGDVAQWFPYGAYGLPASLYQLQAITPPGYLMMAAGALLKIKSALLLFKLSVLAEQWMFLLGLYTLCRHLYRSRLAVLMVCAAAVMSTVWQANIFFNFHMYYLFPWVAYFLLKMLDEEDPRWAGWAAVTMMVWLMGNVPYFASLWVFVFVIFLAVLLCSAGTRAQMVRAWTRPRRAAGTVVAIVLMTTAAGYYLVHALDGVSIATPDRAGGEGAVSLTTFMTYGGNMTWEQLVRGTLLPRHLTMGSHKDSSFYFGLVMIFFLLYAVIGSRRKEFYAFFIPAFVLIGISWGGVIAFYCYYFPGMNYYRHVGLTYGLIKVMLLICAGFGIERYAGLPSGRQLTFFMTGVLAIVIVALNLPSVRGAFVEHWTWVWSEPFGKGLVLTGLLGCVGLFVLSAFRVRTKVPALAFLIFWLLVLDLGAFHLRIPLKVWPAPQLSVAPLLFDARPIPYQIERRETPATEEQKGFLKLLKPRTTVTQYAPLYNVIPFDPCEPKFRIDLMTREMSLLSGMPRVKDAWLGCDVPKARLIKELSSTVTVPGDVQNVFFSSSEARFRVRADDPSGAWFVYADSVHRMWKAEVNGRSVPIEPAFTALKSIHVGPGESDVRLFVASGEQVPSVVLAVLGGLAALGFAVQFLRGLLSPSGPVKGRGSSAG